MGKIDENKLIENPIMLFIILPSATILIIFLVAFYIAEGAGVNNPTVIQLLGVSSSIVIGYITILYVIFTWGIVKQAKESFKQTKIDRQIRYIEKQLEKFYNPLSLHLSINNDLIPAEKLIEISRYHYLAMDPAYDKFRRYLDNNLSIAKRTKTGKELKEEVDSDIYELLEKLRDIMN